MTNTQFDIMQKMITDEELIEKYRKNPSKFVHLARMPIIDNSKHTVETYAQTGVHSFNLTGRPNGLWFAPGNNWLTTIDGLNNPQYTLCCYLYEINFKPTARGLTIANDTDFKAFDKEIPSYWLNVDYFNIVFYDELNSKRYPTTAVNQFNFGQLLKKDNDSYWDIFVRNKIIFEDAVSAKENCAFYKQLGEDIEKFKYKDWSTVGQKYDYVLFENWHLEGERAKYLWYHSLSATSGCVLNADCIKKVKLAYTKKEKTRWVVG